MGEASRSTPHRYCGTAAGAAGNHGKHAPVCVVFVPQRCDFVLRTGPAVGLIYPMFSRFPQSAVGVGDLGIEISIQVPKPALRGNRPRGEDYPRTAGGPTAGGPTAEDRGSDRSTGPSRQPLQSTPRSRRNDMAFPGYKTAAWRRVRARHLRQQPACCWCGSTERLVVDHIKSVRERPNLWETPWNLRTLCSGCHEKRSHRDGHRGRKARLVFQCGLDGFPIDADHPWNKPRGS